MYESNAITHSHSFNWNLNYFSLNLSWLLFTNLFIFSYYVVYRLPGLKFLDSTKVLTTEKTEAGRRGQLMRVVGPNDMVNYTYKHKYNIQLKFFTFSDMKYKNLICAIIIPFISLNFSFPTAV